MDRSPSHRMATGESYTLAGASKRFTFGASPRQIIVAQEITDLDFVGSPNGENLSP